MELDNNDYWQVLEQPPTKRNLSCFNIIELLLMLYFAVKSLINLYSFFWGQDKYSISNCFQIFYEFIIIIAFPIVICGMFGENKKYMKYGFLLFLFACVLVLLHFIIDLISQKFNYLPFIHFCIALFLSFVIMKQIGHI